MKIVYYMFAPLIKLIHDSMAATWICGNANGELVLATDKFVEDAIEAVWSPLLKAVTVPSDIPILAMPADEFPGVNTPIVKCQVGNYIVRAGFSSELMTWVFVQNYEKLPSRSIEEIAKGLDFGIGAPPLT